MELMNKEAGVYNGPMGVHDPSRWVNSQAFQFLLATGTSTSVKDLLMVKKNSLFYIRISNLVKASTFYF